MPHASPRGHAPPLPPPPPLDAAGHIWDEYQLPGPSGRRRAFSPSWAKAHIHQSWEYRSLQGVILWRWMDARVMRL